MTAIPALPDRDARTSIRSDFDDNLVCVAGAGTGKTHELVERMVGAIAAGVAPVEDMAAITFTRKAAGELRGRFFLRLKEATAADEPGAARLLRAVERIDQCFIGTIHAFCARLLRERPLEAGLSPGFSEIEEREELGLMRGGWQRFVEERSASGDERLALFEELGQPLEHLYPFFVRRCQFSDVALKQVATERPDLDPALELTLRLVREVDPEIPASAEGGPPDRFMQTVARTKHFLQYGGPLKDGDKADILTQFNSRAATGVTLNRWPDQAYARRVRDEHLEGLRSQIAPVLRQWRQYLYGVVAGFADEAMRSYRRQRLAAGTLTFQDLLEQCAGMLRGDAGLRAYFRRRHRILFVDEFQDTDPLQAQILLYLSAADDDEEDWRALEPRPGSLFLVGDEKQSIYRFRRADVEVFRLARDRVLASGGRLVELASSFRALPPLVDWLNAAFRPLFDEHAPQFQAAFAELQAARGTSAPDGDGSVASPAPGNVFRIRHEKVQGNRRRVIAQRDAEQIAGFIAAAVRGETGLNVATSAAEPLLGARAAAGDFMILTRTTAMLPLYARCLEERGIAYDIVGTGSLRESVALRSLVELLEAVYDPDDPVPLLAFLRGGLVGLGDDELYEFRRGGGRLDPCHPKVSDGLPAASRQRLEGAFARLRRAAAWLRQMTPAAAIERIVDESGLAAFAAVGEAGSSRAGNLLRVLALVRDWESRRGMDWGQITSELRALIDDDDYRVEEMCLESGRADVVRIMNLHQAKGLQAKVVFLADPADTSWRQWGAEFHVSRVGERPFLSMPVSRSRRNMRPQLIAEPSGWAQDEALERRFAEAEEVRLLYVAATRAQDVLVISSYEASSQQGPWAGLSPALEQVAELPAHAGEPQFGRRDPESSDAAAGEEDCEADLDRARARRAEGWERANEAGYRARAISDDEEAEDGEDDSSGEEDSSQTAAAPGAGNAPGTTAQRRRGGRGRAYGVLVHRVFELAVRGELPADEEKYARALAAASQVRPSLVEESLEALRRLRSSALWREVSAADTVYTEVPLAMRVEADGVAEVVRGVIDLVYLTAGGQWRIVDYKTDPVDGETAAAITARYAGQVAAYARYWESISGESVAAMGIWSTEQGYLAV